MYGILRRELDRLKKSLLSMSAVVEENVHRAVSAYKNNDAELARKAIKTDAVVNQMEIDVEEDCLKILALHQPVAIDLRLIVAILKINNDLERIGDQAVNISHVVASGSMDTSFDTGIDITSIADDAIDMLKKSLDSLINVDDDLAHLVCRMDDDVDEQKDQIIADVIEKIRQKPDKTEAYIDVFLVAKNLERIADLATNISEGVIYMNNGNIVRHKYDKRLPDM